MNIKTHNPIPIVNPGVHYPVCAMFDPVYRSVGLQIQFLRVLTLLELVLIVSKSVI